MSVDMNAVIRDAVKEAEEKLKKDTGKDYKVDEAGIILQLRALTEGQGGVDKGRVFNWNVGTLKGLDKEESTLIKQDQ